MSPVEIVLMRRSGVKCSKSRAILRSTSLTLRRPFIFRLSTTALSALADRTSAHLRRDDDPLLNRAELRRQQFLRVGFPRALRAFVAAFPAAHVGHPPILVPFGLKIDPVPRARDLAITSSPFTRRRVRAAAVLPQSVELEGRGRRERPPVRLCAPASETRGGAPYESSPRPDHRDVVPLGHGLDRAAGPRGVDVLVATVTVVVAESRVVQLGVRRGGGSGTAPGKSSRDSRPSARLRATYRAAHT